MSASDPSGSLLVVVRNVQRADAAGARLAREIRTRGRLATGELGVDVHGLRDRPATLRVEYVGQPGRA